MIDSAQIRRNFLVASMSLYIAVMAVWLVLFDLNDKDQRIWRSVSIQREKSRQRLIRALLESQYCHAIIRMHPGSFMKFCDMLEAEDEVWEALIEKKTAAKAWKDKTIRNYNKLVTLHGKDRATLSLGSSMQDIREELGTPSRSSRRTIEQIDDFVSDNEVQLENDSAWVDLEGDEVPELTPTSMGFSKRPIKKRKSNISDNMGAILINKLDAFADKMAAALVESSRPAPNLISDAEIWEIICQMGLKGEKKNQAYVFLLYNRDKIGGLLAAPEECRRGIMDAMLDRTN